MSAHRAMADALALVFNRGRWRSRTVGDRHGEHGADRWRDEPERADPVLHDDPDADIAEQLDEPGR